MTNAKLSSGAQVNLNLSLVTEALYHFNLNGDASNPLLAQKSLMTLVISSMMVAHDKMTYCQRQVSCLCYIGLHNKAQQMMKMSRNLPIIKFVKCVCVYISKLPQSIYSEILKVILTSFSNPTKMYIISQWAIFIQVSKLYPSHHYSKIQ